MRDRLALGGYALAAVGFALDGVLSALPASWQVEFTATSGPLAGTLTFVLKILGLTAVSRGCGPEFVPREKWGWRAVVGGLAWQVLAAGLFQALGKGTATALALALVSLPGMFAISVGFALLLAVNLKGRALALPYSAAGASAAANTYSLYLFARHYQGDPFYLTFLDFLFVLASVLFTLAAALAAYKLAERQNPRGSRAKPVRIED